VDDLNEEYFARYVASRPGAPDLKVLDYGCGHGELVERLVAEGVDAYGTDVLYEGANFDALFQSELYENGRIRVMAGTSIPFEDGTFDLVVSNQVFEHVEKLRPAVTEVHRVLREGGTAYHHFPCKETLREGHSGIPLAHRLPRNGLRLGYAKAVHRAGFGLNRDAWSSADWPRHILDWIDRYTYYRPYREIREEFGRLFVIRHREIEYCRFRARARGSRPLTRLLEIEPLTGLHERLFRRLGFLALETVKRP
jgi:SAM-dependent methyltransferase